MERRCAIGPVRASRTQMWVYVINVGVVKEKLDGKSNNILLELWYQLKPEQPSTIGGGPGKHSGLA